MKFLIAVLLLLVTSLPAKAVNTFVPFAARQGVIGVTAQALHCPDSVSDTVYPLHDAYFQIVFDSEGVTKEGSTDLDGNAYVEGWSTTTVTVIGYHNMVQTQPVTDTMFFGFYYCETYGEAGWTWKE